MTLIEIVPVAFAGFATGGFVALAYARGRINDLQAAYSRMRDQRDECRATISEMQTDGDNWKGRATATTTKKPVIFGADFGSKPAETTVGPAFMGRFRAYAKGKDYLVISETKKAMKLAGMKPSSLSKLTHAAAKQNGYKATRRRIGDRNLRVFVK